MLLIVLKMLMAFEDVPFFLEIDTLWSVVDGNNTVTARQETNVSDTV